MDNQNPGNMGNQNPYPQNNYQQDEQNEVMTTGQWILTLIIVMIPCVNIIMLLVWAFGSNGNNNRKNFSRAQLIILVIQAVLGALLFSTFMAGIYSLLGSYY